MTDCRIIPCYKLFLRDLKEIMLTKPINFSNRTISYSSDSNDDRSPDIDIEHISIRHHHQFPLGSTVVEAVNRGVQTHMRSDTHLRNNYCKSCTTRETAGSSSSILNSRFVNGQVVSYCKCGRSYMCFIQIKAFKTPMMPTCKQFYSNSIYRTITVTIIISRKSVRPEC